jgi:putative transposase
VEPACAVLEFPVSTYYAAKKRQRKPSPRDFRDERLKKEIMRVWEDRKKGRRLYGARKVWLQLRREGIAVARCTVERLMRELGIAGVAARRKKPRTTVPDAAGQRPADLLERDFSAPAPNRRWVADITYVDTASGFACTAFVTDLFGRKIVGWQVADHLRAGLALDALEMAIFARQDQIGTDLVHHSDRGVQYTSIHCTQRLEDIGAVRSAGSKGDCPLTGQSRGLQFALDWMVKGY